MRFLIQRVSEAEVKVDSVSIGHIQNGFLVIVGISKEDTCEIADKMIHKLLNLRIFEDEAKAVEQPKKKRAPRAPKAAAEEAPMLNAPIEKTTFGDLEALAALKEQLSKGK